VCLESVAIVSHVLLNLTLDEVGAVYSVKDDSESDALLFRLFQEIFTRVSEELVVLVPGIRVRAELES